MSWAENSSQWHIIRRKAIDVDLEFDEDQEELRESVRSFLQAECPPGLVRKIVETGDPKAAEDLWSEMVSLDWPALSVPEEFGGVGLGFVECAVVAEELGAVIAPGPYFPTVTQFTTVLRELGTQEQKNRFIKSVVSGEITGTLAVADHPRSWWGSQTQHSTTRAQMLEGRWILNGEKYAVMGGSSGSGVSGESSGPGAPGADEVVVVAGTDNGVGVFVVPSSKLVWRQVRSLDATRDLYELRIDSVEVPDDRVLGDPGTLGVGEGLARAVQEATVALALETVGTCQTLFDLTLQYAKDRHQFGVPIGSFQAVKHKMADMFVALERARSLCYYAVAAIAEDDGSRSLATSMAKAAADDCQRLVCQESIQTFGGIGFTWEHDAHLFVKRAKSSGALFGSAVDHRRRISEILRVEATG